MKSALLESHMQAALPPRKTYREQLAEFCDDKVTNAERFAAFEGIYDAKRFAAHVIETFFDGAGYLCHSPGTNVDSFRVIFSPGAILMYGDVGEMVIVRPGGSSLAWFKESIGSRSYFLSKCPTARREFSPADAAGNIDDVALECPATAKRFWLKWDAASCSHAGELESRWYEACQFVYQEPVICERYSQNDARCYAALKWFAGRVGAWKVRA